jgi:hypothetical protein
MMRAQHVRCVTAKARVKMVVTTRQGKREMHAFTQFVLGLSAVTIAFSLVLMLLQLQRIRCAVEGLRHTRHSHHNHYGTSHHVAVSGPQGGFAVFVYRDGSWHLEADLSAPGCEATPPTIAGSFDGQVVKKESSPRSVR